MGKIVEDQLGDQHRPLEWKAMLRVRHNGQLRRLKCVIQRGGVGDTDLVVVGGEHQRRCRDRREVLQFECRLLEREPPSLGGDDGPVVRAIGRHKPVRSSDRTVARE